MRFDLLLAVFSSGLYAPLALMAGGFILAVGGLAALMWRRKKLAKPTATPDEASQDAPETSASEVTDGPASTPAPAVPEGRRRRSLVGGAERDSGTPAGEQLTAGDATVEDPGGHEAEQEAYEAEDARYGEQEGDEAAFAAEFSEIEREDNSGEAYDADLDAEWAEPAIGEPAEPAVSNTAAALVGGLAASTPEVEEHSVEEQVEPAVSDAPLPSEIAIARGHPIVFRQFIPQSLETDGLSFFGGQPIGPPDFQWPRAGDAQDGAPLQFVMQWDCAQLCEQDATGLLPQDGALYCFINNDFSGDKDLLSSHSFVHHRGDASTWEPVTIPQDAGPALGKDTALVMSGCTGAVENAESFAPRVLPRFPFASIALAYPAPGEDAQMLWSNEDTTDALLNIQQGGAAMTQASSANDYANESHGRPFDAFPHDFGSVRVIASRIIEALDEPDDALAGALYPDLSVEELEAQFAGWREEAKEVYILGTQRPAGQSLEQNIANDIWQWFEERSGILGSDTPCVFTEAVDNSLGVGSEALGAIPANWIDKAMHSHALARDGEAGGSNGQGPVIAQTPARMFGPPSASSDATSARASEDILLLELPSGAGPEHKFQARVLQYWISPDDLAAGRFDRVTLTTA